MSETPPKFLPNTPKIAALHLFCMKRAFIFIGTPTFDIHFKFV
jgi:hypothetical protein